MAVKLSNNRGGVGGVPPVSEINVTPLVDVMLVLLIVFMVAAPLMASGVKVDLPTSNAKPLSEEKPPVAVSLNAQGKLYVDKTEVTNATLVSALSSATEGDKTRRINIRGDKGLAYGKVIETMGEINDAGFSRKGSTGNVLSIIDNRHRFTKGELNRIHCGPFCRGIV